MTIQAYGKNAAKANEEVQNRINIIENAISTTKEDSLICRLNSGYESSVKADNDTYNLIDFGLYISEKTDGALNIALYPVTSAWGFTTENYRVPSDEEIRKLLKYTDYSKITLSSKNEVTLQEGMKLDLGAIGKGFAGDRAIDILKNNGITSALLDLGGNIQTIGLKPDGSEWTIGIKNPWDGTIAAGLKINNQAVITSGGYERFFTGDDGKKYIHIFDSKTGRPVENDLASVSIITNSGLYGDALSTALFVMGLDKAIDFWKSNRDFEMIIITEPGDIYYTANLSEKINLISEFNSINIIR